MPAELEEIAGGPDRVETQGLGPDCRDDLLGRGAGRGIIFVGRARDLGQQRAIHFAVGIQRQPVEHRDIGRDHVVGQRLREMAPQLPALGRCARRRDDVGSQAVGGVDDDRLSNRWMACQRSLDLAELDAEAAEIDLVVDAAEEFDRAVVAIPDDVPGPIEPGIRPRAERIRHEALRRQLRTIQVTVRYAVAAEIQFARHTHRRRTHLRVEHIELRIGDRAADRHRSGAGRNIVDQMPGREGGVFGRPIDMQQALGPSSLEDAPDRLRVDRLAAEQHVPHRRERVRHIVGDLIEQRRREKVRGDAFGPEEFGKPARRQGHVALDADQRAAIEQRAPDFEGRGVERRVGGLRDPVRRSQLHEIAVADEAHDRAMRHRDALGDPGRTRRIDHIGQPLGIGRQRQAVVRKPIELVAQSVDGDEARITSVEVRQQVALSEHDLGPAVAHHHGQPLGRVGGVERHVGAPGLEDRHHGDHHVGPALQMEPDQVAVASAGRLQIPRHLVGTPVKRGIAQPLRAPDNGWRIRSESRLRFEQGRDGRIARIWPRGVVPFGHGAP